MAAAEYYSNMPMTGQHYASSYNQPLQHQSSAISPYIHNASIQSQQSPPPYAEAQHHSRPTVHFADQQKPQHPHRNSFSSQAPIPVASEQQYGPQVAQRPSPQLQPVQPPRPAPQQLPPGAYLHPDSAHHNSQVSAPPRPYLNDTHSQQTLPSYSSDPEPRRRRRRRHSHESRDYRRSDRENERSSHDVRDGRPSKGRSRSTTTDALLGATGAGLIGDLVFPGLGTVGMAALGYIGGKDYGKHRKMREERLERAQDEWDKRYRHGEYDHERAGSHSGRRDHGDKERYKHDY